MANIAGSSSLSFPMLGNFSFWVMIKVRIIYAVCRCGVHFCWECRWLRSYSHRYL